MGGKSGPRKRDGTDISTESRLARGHAANHRSAFGRAANRVDPPQGGQLFRRKRFHHLPAPLNSSISAISFKISGVIVMFLISWAWISIYTHFYPIAIQ